MITTTEPGQVMGDNPQLVDEDLDAAVHLAREQATKESRHGILVTRHTSVLHRGCERRVPYGMIQESCQIRASRRWPKAKKVESTSNESEAIPEGSHVDLISHGHYIGRGVIDAWMLDGSAFWIWLHHGAGRRLVHEIDMVKLSRPGRFPTPPRGRESCQVAASDRITDYRIACGLSGPPQEWDAGASP